MPRTPPFRRVLIANRGEIAVRICRALRELGIESVAVHSQVDRRSAHVLAADHAFPLGGNTAAESYLDVGKLLSAAKALDAQAIHPGYGFLSESSHFARAVREAGLVFLGPNPEAMDRLGGKRAAREEAMAAGVPVIATEVGGIAEQLTHLETGVLVPPDDPRALADWMVRLHEDPELRRRLSAAAAERVRERFTVDRQGALLHGAYLAALNLRHGPPPVRRRTLEAL